MKIALIGYGGMGKVIEEKAIARGHEIVLRVTKDSDPSWKDALKNADVAIEFTQPEAAVQNIYTCFEQNIPVIIGTTGWFNHLHEVSDSCIDMNQALFYASNFSIGVNIFFQLNRQLARLMATHSSYQINMEELHHTRKKDAPSGTAITLAEGIIAEHPSYKAWRKSEEPIAPKSFPIHSIRQDDIPGTHSIEYRSEIDSINITHTAFNRDGFALGAVVAAEFLYGKKGVFTMSDLLTNSSSHGL